jgi:hypothetical protein
MMEAPGTRAILRVVGDCDRHPLQFDVSAGRIDVPAKLFDQRVQLRATVAKQFAANQVQRLNAIGSFIELRDGCRASVAPCLTDVAMAAIQLHAEARDFLTDIGEECLDDGISSAARRRPRAGSRVLRCVFEVQLRAV